MKYLAMLIAAIAACSCASNETKKVNTETQLTAEVKQAHEKVYRNPDGIEVTLSRQNDSTMRTTFKDTAGHIFDTVMKIVYNCKMKNMIAGYKKDTFPFLVYSNGWGGIQLLKDTLCVWEFSNVAALGYDSKMHNKVYDGPYLKVK